MANLLSLPAEILLLIPSYIHSVGDANGLLNLCLTSRTLRTFTQPLIFRDYDRTDDYIHSNQNHKEGRIGPLLCFTQTHLPVTDKVKFLSGIMAAKANPLLVLLISQAPNLEELDLMTSDEATLSKIVNSCKRLEGFVYIASPCNSHQYISVLEPHKSSLGAISIDLHRADRSVCHWDECPQYDSFVSFTNLYRLKLEQGSIQDLTALPASLEVLGFHLCDYPVFDMLDTLIEMSQTSLQSLYLDNLDARCFSVGILGLT
ncbi:hypothetical protein BO94DRAFT_615480 [Aspergillus sclerotioniger CBS 115572]|uniref:F-box domain-containing protein n=1 Tax=Aspergillus sclerotioniger CBS 115572 TaxID=1450535 RepID=A0A317USI2_9EURO|nr:hypothetical protein BO94DRAFT_615480 [Aspergillus sclerotioniger CBS 115572]PWY65013.1 hypothetical protein BO94DRAFT_615480 [Aspergillus sclerotioniger CBS 115572]